jgi:hypothetical protein
MPPFRYLYRELPPGSDQELRAFNTTLWQGQNRPTKEEMAQAFKTARGQYLLTRRHSPLSAEMALLVLQDKQRVGKLGRIGLRTWVDIESDALSLPPWYQSEAIKTDETV